MVFGKTKQFKKVYKYGCCDFLWHNGALKITILSTNHKPEQKKIYQSQARMTWKCKLNQKQFFEFLAKRKLLKQFYA